MLEQCSSYSVFRINHLTTICRAGLRNFSFPKAEEAFRHLWQTTVKLTLVWENSWLLYRYYLCGMKLQTESCHQAADSLHPWFRDSSLPKSAHKTVNESQQCLCFHHLPHFYEVRWGACREIFMLFIKIWWYVVIHSNNSP